MSIGFNANIIVMKRQYNEKDIPFVMKIINDILYKEYGISIQREIPFEEYIKQSASKPVNRYIRMPASLFSKVLPPDAKKPPEDAKEINIKYKEPEPVESSHFSNSRHFVISMSGMNEDYVVLWFNFHHSLYNKLPGFIGCINNTARHLSIRFNTEAVFIHGTSMSRSDALFNLYSNGAMRSSENGKDSLTVLKNDYGIDINKCMNNVDNNVAVYYAPFDLAAINSQIYEQEQRYKKFMQISEKTEVKDQVTGESMTSKFAEDNESIMKNLSDRRDRTMEAMAVDPFGSLWFVEFNKDINTGKTSSGITSEFFLGRR